MNFLNWLFNINYSTNKNEIIYAFPPEMTATEIIAEYKKNKIENDKPQEVIIKEGSIDTSKLLNYKSDEKNKYIYRPQNFNEFIGQIKNKERIKMAIKRIKLGMKVHFFFNARPGMGKTTMARIISNILNSEFIEKIGKQVTPESLINIMNNFYKSNKKKCILFIDEIDTLSYDTCKILNPLLEDFAIANKKIKPFIFIGATIDKAKLVKRGNGDMLDRISDHIYFEPYEIEDIEKILIQYHQNLYNHFKVNEKDLKLLSKNCKESPRIAITMLEYYLASNNVQKVLEYFKIIKNGLTMIDVTILKVLAERYPKTLGASALSQKVRINAKDYIEIYESYLVEKGYIDRIPMRKISQKGLNFLYNLNERR